MDADAVWEGIRIETILTVIIHVFLCVTIPGNNTEHFQDCWERSSACSLTMADMESFTWRKWVLHVVNSSRNCCQCCFPNVRCMVEETKTFLFSWSILARASFVFSTRMTNSSTSSSVNCNWFCSVSNESSVAFSASCMNVKILILRRFCSCFNPVWISSVL